MGRSFQVARSYQTSSTISPPVRNGSISSRSSLRPYSTPIPVGPSILWPDRAKKSQSKSITSTGMWGALWAASTNTVAPIFLAFAVSSLTGFMVPTPLDICTIASSLVRGVMYSSMSLRSILASLAKGRIRKVAPLSAATFCHGTKLEWCSIGVTMISSPGPMCSCAHVWATRLMDSVVFRVQTISCGSRALMNFATFTRALSYRSVASWLRW